MISLEIEALPAQFYHETLSVPEPSEHNSVIHALKLEWERETQTSDILEEAASLRAAVASVSLIAISSNTCSDLSRAITLSLKSSG